MTWSLYRLLTNTPLTWRETLPGAIVAALFLQASFQVLPLFVRLSNELIARRPTAASSSCSSGST